MVGRLSIHLRIIHKGMVQDCTVRCNTHLLKHTDIIRYLESMDLHKRYSLLEKYMPYTELGILFN
jgi:hypothetical protein